MSFSDKVLGFGAFANRGVDADLIEQSLVFATGDDSYLHRTPSSASNRKTWTWSGWVKRGKYDISGQPQTLFGTGDGNQNQSNSTFFWMGFYDKKFYVQDWDNNLKHVTNRYFRDTAAWYHIVVAFDTTQATAANRIKIFVNGVQETSLEFSVSPAQNYDAAVNSVIQHRIGSVNRATYDYRFDGYMAEVHFIDGTALAPSAFGETNSATGQWVPKEYDAAVSGAYGTNGFYLKLKDSYPGLITSASGGTVTTVDTDYKVHTFNSSGTFTVNTISGGDAAIDFLVIGGGGGGGYSYGGGGGAGGYRTSYGTSGGNSAAELPISVTTQAYTITVGDGGDGATGHRNPPLGNGDDSSIAGAGMTTITSIGGGGGGNITYQQPTGWGSGQLGGSGGGAGSLDNDGDPANGLGYAGAGTTGQGYPGSASANQDTGGSAGGGGGAGGTGTANTGHPSYVGGTGGTGLASTITGSSVTRAGGGGGGGYTQGAPGGPGGGGYGGDNQSGGRPAADGTANTGSGGGGLTVGSLPAGSEGDGGSGVVIIRYKFQ